MDQVRTYSGDWEDVLSKFGLELAGHKVEVRVLEETDPRPNGKMIYAGMFPQLLCVTANDFEAAEFRHSKIFDVKELPYFR